MSKLNFFIGFFVLSGCTAIRALAATEFSESFTPSPLITITDITTASDLQETLPCIIDCVSKPVASPSASPTLTTASPGPIVPGTTSGSNSPPIQPSKPTIGGPPLNLGQLIPGEGGVILNQLTLLGGKIFDFVVSSKPNATYNTVKASVVPAGITNFTQLAGWSKPVSKVYHVDFKNLFGEVGGSFDYRITYLYGGHFQGKGKFLGEIAFVPANIKLHTDRSVNIHAEILDPLNFGTETDPVAGIQLQITFSSPTTLNYEMHSIEYFIYGTGEIEDLTGGTSP